MLNWFRLKACAKCGGDLAPEDGDWICLQCGTYDYIGLYSKNQLLPGFDNLPPQALLKSPPEEKSWTALGLCTKFPQLKGAGGYWAASLVLGCPSR